MILPGYPTGLLSKKADFPVVRDKVASAVDDSVTLPTYFAGDMLLVLAANRSFGVPTPISAPSGWNTLFNGTRDYHTFVGFWRISDGGEGAALSLTGSNVALAYAIDKHGGVIETSSVVVGRSTTVDPPACTPSFGQQKTLWLPVAARSYWNGPVGGSLTIPTNYSDLLRQVHSSNWVEVFSCQRSLEVISENPSAYTVTGNRSFSVYTLAIRGS